MDSVFLLGSVVLWGLMAFLVIGLQKLEPVATTVKAPVAKTTPSEEAKK